MTAFDWKYNMLTITNVYRGPLTVMADCLCECGKTKTHKLSLVKNGHDKSCGCLGSKNRFKTGSKLPLLSNFADRSTEATSYWGGFLFGDGSVDGKGGLKVGLSDKHGAPDFLRSLSRHVFGVERVSVTPRKCRCDFSVQDVSLCNNLAAFGIVRNKTTLQSLIIPPDAIARHVIRGYFDADGWFTKSMQGKYTRYAIGICSYLADSMELVRSIIPVPAILSKKSNQELFELKVNRREHINELVNWLAPEDKSLCYPYKWDKIWEFQKRFALLQSQGGNMT